MSEADLRRIVQELNDKAKDDSERPVSVHYKVKKDGKIIGYRIESNKRVLSRWPDRFRGSVPHVWDDLTPVYRPDKSPILIRHKDYGFIV